MRVRTVHSFEELVETPFADGVNALCWPRTLPGPFGEVVEKLGPGEEIVTIEEEQLGALDVSAAGRIAIEVLREDLRRLRELERDPVLNCIHSYPRDDGRRRCARMSFRGMPIARRWRPIPGSALTSARRAKACPMRRRNGVSISRRFAPSS
jgi:hypothetical protein